MKKIALFAFLICALLGLSVTSSYALQAGCNPEIYDIQKHHADAMRVRDSAYAHQIVKRNDPALGLTCFDQQMGLTSRLGYIFSDNVTVNPPPPDTAAFGAPLSYPSWGLPGTTATDGTLSNLLLVDLHTVITPTLVQTLTNFLGIGNYSTVLSGAGGFLDGGFLGTLMGSLSGPLGQITSIITNAMSMITTFTTALSTLSNFVSLLPITTPVAVTALIALLQAAAAVVQQLISAFMSFLSSMLAPILAAIKNFIMGPDTSMSGANACNGIQELWNDNASTTGIESVVGNGIENGTGYFNFQDLVGGTMPTMGTDFTGQITGGAGNQGLLTQAMTDLTTLSAPGGVASWPVPPVFGANATTAAVIGGM